MLILKSQQFSDEQLLEYAISLSSNSGGIKEKILHWSFGPIMTMKYDVNAQNYLFSDEKVPFHWDGAFFREPRLLLFYCTESEGEGGETLFTDTEKIWESLSEEEKADCSKVKLHYRTNQVAHYGGEIEIPLVQVHPKTGNTILRFAEKVETQLNPVELGINGIEEQDLFYQKMVSKLYSPEFMYEHRWDKGDLIIVDNYRYLHGRNSLRENRKRTFKRVQIL